MYNTTSDIGETTNLLAFNPAIAHDLSLALQSYLVGVNALMPVAIATNLPVAPPTVLGAPIPGDYNGDSIVDAGDYATWRAEFGSQTHLAADGNRNGTVDTADYVFWRNIFAALGTGSIAGGPGQVPEPTAVFLCLSAAALFAARPMRRHR